MTRLKIIVIILLWISSPTLNGQSDDLKSVVLSELDSSPLENVHVFVKRKINGTLTDTNGQFELSNLEKNDTIIFSCIGFAERKIIFQNKIIEEIKLVPEVYELPKMLVNSGIQEEIELGFLEKDIDENKISSIGIGLSKKNINVALQFGLPFFNPKKHVGKIEEIEIFLHKKGKPKAPFRIQLFELNDKQEVGSPILDQNIVIKNAKGGRWTKINLKDYNIPFPENGFLLVVEWLTINKNKYWYKTKWRKVFDKTRRQELKKRNKWNAKRVGYGPLIGSYKTNKKHQSMWKIPKRGWKKHESNYQPMIKTKISIWK